ncbi:MAG: branched-chain amino acid ABC transporter permease [Deltaproteobacteria bacterium]|nr:branched-chain amino acid ABC transporter permease [Deltaproteobacteria bacterium]MBW1848159.1 branched-chain amino acid ABC transporter permease [Deltaproteobacteria bacterium]MBW1983866.1 branched-chain amino acid ABC transporter permease [Deltaproteobacteria bacterium]MBW2180174.1 branched-chain amino acid ABC transporter permease [Deltaproteobacteria bacterium]MBW2365621.1 branched-chain amino acid ABC transporter permease [Deltaproteobacteria bacterium]
MNLLNEILQTILSGISVGCIYGLIALGFVMIFKATEVINFAQGELMMVGAFIAFSLISFFHLSYWTTLLLTTLIMALFGMIIERVVLRPLVGQPIFSLVMVTIGMMIFFKSVVSMIPFWGTDTYGFGTPFTEKLVRYNEIIVSWEHLSIIILTLLLILALFIFFRFTKMGVAMRATSQNQLAAVYMGISVNRVFSLTWVISAILGGFAGILLSPITFVHMNMGLIGLKAMPAAILGGFYSIPGAVVGGLIIGVTESLAGAYLPIGWKDVAAWIILILVLVIRPYGLFGTELKKKV